jgi:hypothetical protein
MARASINKQEIARMMREIQREFDQHSIRVPVQADSDISPINRNQGNTNIYNGPVIHGDANGAQLAWANREVHQAQARTEQIAPGYEALAQTVVKILEQLAFSGLPDDEQADVELAANEVLAEITRAEPDRGKVHRALSVVKGGLAPVAMGLVKGTASGLEQWAGTAIEQLGKHF